MAKLEVIYSVVYKQVIDWPDDELNHLNHANLVCNLDTEESNLTGAYPEVHQARLNGKTLPWMECDHENE